MSKKNILKLSIIGAIFVIIAGSVLHFVYEWSGENVIVGIFAPVNESVWEHMKLSTFPFLLFALLELYLLRKNLKNFWCAKAAEVYLAIIFMIAFFYTYNIFVEESILFLDILSFVIAVVLGKFVSYKILVTEKQIKGMFLSVIFLIILISAFVVFTFYPPEFGLFKEELEAQTVNTNQPVNTTNTENKNIEPVNSQPASGLVEPVEKFKERITLKPFGIYITPANSPVQPERFSGYHTGVDVEFTDQEDEISVKAIAPGTVINSKTVSGYGGVLVIRHEIDDKQILVIYGHLDPDSLLKIDTEVEAGQIIGVLGEGDTAETDFERKHLHFGMLRGQTVDLRGYVDSEAGLDGWYDPMEFFD